jgi:hypothetical protein
MKKQQLLPMEPLLLRTRRVEDVESSEGVAAPESEDVPESQEEVLARIGDDDGGGGGDFDDDNGGGGDSGLGATIWFVSSAATLGLAALIFNLFRGALTIPWAALSGTAPVVPGGEDTIALADGGPGTPGAFTVTLVAPPRMTWWKAAELYDRTGTLRGTAFTQDTSRSSSMIVPASQVAGGFLVLKKAKFWGVHTAMYVIPDAPVPPGTTPELSTMVGRNLTLTWVGASGETTF